MAQYLALTKTFIAPHTVEEGQKFTISDDWEPGPHVQPLDAAAEAAFERYEQKRKDLKLPPATLEPVEARTNTIESIDTPVPVNPDLSLSIAEALAGKASPGPTEPGGKIAEQKLPDGKGPLKDEGADHATRTLPPGETATTERLDTHVIQNEKIDETGKPNPDRKGPEEAAAKTGPGPLDKTADKK